MRIVADNNIPGIQDYCGDLGAITLVDGRGLRRRQLAGADVLLVRSVTRVDAELLDDSAIGYVGTATAGIDHIDTEYLAKRGIHFAAAPGCNAVAAAEYVTACVLAYCLETAQDPKSLTVGVIGCGHVGRALVRMLEQLGMECLRNDPPRAAGEGEQGFCSLARALTADVVTLHVPLTESGEWPTRNLLGEAEFKQLQAHALVINAARGGVLDESAWLAGPRSQRLVLDCWRGEPRINRGMLEQCWIATPHIAGHTVDARLRAARMLAADLRAFLGKPALRPHLPDPAGIIDITDDQPRSPLAQVAAVVADACAPLAYSRETRGLKNLPALDVGPKFDELRRRFGRRREFSAYQVRGVDITARGLIEGLGFTCSP